MLAHRQQKPSSFSSPSTSPNGAGVESAPFGFATWLLLQAPGNAGILPACATSIPLALQLYSYGLGSDARQITAKIGGAAVIVQKVESVTSIAASLSFSRVPPVISPRLSRASKDGCSTQKDVHPSTDRGSGAGCLAGFASWPPRRSKSHRHIREPCPLLAH
jgi:hypothetical protein